MSPTNNLAAPTAGRLMSLEAFRGFTMFWIVGGKSLMMALRAFEPNLLVGWVAYQLEQTPWEGLRYYDVIWPSFMLMVGMSIPFSFARQRPAEALGAFGPLFSAAAVLLAERLILYWMYRRKIFLRA